MENIPIVPTYPQTVDVPAAAQRMRHIAAALQIPTGRNVRTLPVGRRSVHHRIGHANRQRPSIRFPFTRIRLHVQLAGVLCGGRLLRQTVPGRRLVQYRVRRSQCGGGCRCRRLRTAGRFGGGGGGDGGSLVRSRRDRQQCRAASQRPYRLGEAEDQQQQPQQRCVCD